VLECDKLLVVFCMSQRCIGRCGVDLANADYKEAEASAEANEGIRDHIFPRRIVS
jgi:hypothetical protein